MQAGDILERGMADESFKEFVVDQLCGLPELRTQAMFGGHGLSQGDQFFGILMDGRLYFKADDRTRPTYLKRGMGPFVYKRVTRTLPMHYFEVPPEVLEDREALVLWAKRAIQVAARARKSPKRSKQSGKIRSKPRSTAKNQRS